MFFRLLSIYVTLFLNRKTLSRLDQYVHHIGVYYYEYKLYTYYNIRTQSAWLGFQLFST